MGRQPQQQSIQNVLRHHPYNQVRLPYMVLQRVTHSCYHVASVGHTAGSHLAKHSGTKAHSRVVEMK